MVIFNSYVKLPEGNMQGYKQLQTNQKFKFHAFLNADVPKVAPCHPCQVGTNMKKP